jgi:hypothetical protein
LLSCELFNVSIQVEHCSVEEGVDSQRLEADQEVRRRLVADQQVVVEEPRHPIYSEEQSQYYVHPSVIACCCLPFSFQYQPGT